MRSDNMADINKLHSKGFWIKWIMYTTSVWPLGLFMGKNALVYIANWVTVGSSGSTVLTLHIIHQVTRLENVISQWFQQHCRPEFKR